MDLLFALLPVACLIWLMTKPRPMPSHLALPLAALLAWATRAFYFNDAAPEWSAAIVAGLLQAWTPILIVAGAIFFFKAMEASGAMEIIRRWLESITPNPVARLLIIGWAFQYLIEGASGFGTPAALAAPLLVGLGFPALRVAAYCLVLDSVPVGFGAVGTPVWFGLGQLGLSDAMLREAGIQGAVINGLCGLVIVPVGLRLLVPWSTIRSHLVFISLSVLACAVPAWAVAHFSVEFPSVVGGLIGLLATIALAKARIALPVDPEAQRPYPPPPSTAATAHPLSVTTIFLALLPILGTVALLLITRIRQLGLRDLLQAVEPALQLPLGNLGTIRLSASLVVEWNNLLGQGFDWSHPLLYVPSIIPFLLIGFATLWLSRSSRAVQWSVGRDTLERMLKPAIALFGALVFVRLLMTGGAGASSMIIGNELAALTGPLWSWAAVFLGVLGSFFSGSATVSNLTFGGIQLAIAATLELNATTILALQIVGASLGNMVAIHNIVAVCSILGLQNSEGAILKKTAVPMVIYGIVAAILANILYPMTYPA